ncbi:hypothetical protein H8D51_04455 [bacterium]|nr:hypothetical protein [bacterium]
MKLHQWLLSLRVVAGVLLAACLLMPICYQPAAGGESIPTYFWMMIDNNPGTLFLLVVAYLWPLLIVLLLLNTLGEVRILATILEPLLVLVSALIIVTTVLTTFSWQPLFSWWPVIGVLVSGTPAAGSWLGLIADLLYLLAWLGLLLTGYFYRQWQQNL